MIEKLVKTARLTTLISFVIGTVIFVVYFFTANFILLGLGYCYIALTVTTNLFVLILMLNAAAVNKQGRKSLLTSAALMLINIPIMLAYCWATMVLLDTMRITFKNTTTKTLTDIHLTGCETKLIGTLEPGYTRTVWVGIKSDCSITMDYLVEGVRKKELIVGYVTGGNGDKMRHQIGKKQLK